MVSQYTSHEDQCFLGDNNTTCSMSTVGSCYDNAVAENFFDLLKLERVNHRRYTTRAEASADVLDYIEVFYNTGKRHKLTMTAQTALN